MKQKKLLNAISILILLLSCNSAYSQMSFAVASPVNYRIKYNYFEKDLPNMGYHLQFNYNIKKKITLQLSISSWSVRSEKMKNQITNYPGFVNPVAFKHKQPIIGYNHIGLGILYEQPIKKTQITFGFQANYIINSFTKMISKNGITSSSRNRNSLASLQYKIPFFPSISTHWWWKKNNKIQLGTGTVFSLLIEQPNTFDSNKPIVNFAVQAIALQIPIAK